ncbi:MAG: phage holin family protein [Xanthobacteraceae bacterium]
MAHERLRAATVPFSEVAADLADLFQKELRLARAELSDKLSHKVSAGIWMSVAGVLGLVAALVLIEAAVFAIASFGIALHWACLIVAAILGALAAGFYFKGKSDAREELTPARTIHQVRRDIATAKEQLT